MSNRGREREPGPGSPRFTRWILSTAVRSEDREFIVGDLDEEFVRRGRSAEARRWYRSQALRSATSSLLARIRDTRETGIMSRTDGGWFEGLFSDLGHALGTLRLFGRSPVFAVTGITIVALGVGAATAIFSVVYGIMLRPLPFPEQERLVSIWLVRNSTRNYPAAADAIDLRQLRVFEDVAFFENINLNLVGDGDPQRLQGASVSPNLFSLLGASAALGRTFAPDEDQEGRNRVVLLSDATWRGQFGGDNSVVGSRIDLNGSPYTVIGVTPPDFLYPSAAHQAWVPLVLEPGEATREATDNYRVVARLAPGATLDQARREAATLASRIASVHGGNAGMIVDSMLDDAVRDVRPTLLLLMGAVMFLLLIACANLSNLFAARAAARRADFAVRLALGASRTRLVAQAIAEVTPILLVGGLLGLLGTVWMVRVFVASQPPGLPRLESIQLSTPVLIFSLALLILTGLAATLLPAGQAWGADFTVVTKESGRNSTAGRGRTSGRKVAVAAQAAFALPLLIGASLLLRSALEVARVDVGFRPEGVLTAKFEVSRSRHPSDQQVSDYYAMLVDAVRAVPGVTGAGLVNRIPLSDGQTNPVHFERATGGTDDLTNVETRTVTPGYFQTLEIPLLAGREFDERDDADAPAVVIVDERVARTNWPGESVIGKRLREPAWRGGRWAQVVGVVAHVRTAGLEVEALPQVYWSHRQWTQDRMVLAVQSGLDLETLVAPVAEAIRSVDPEQSLYEVSTIDQIVDRSQAKRRLTTVLMIGFGGASLLLTAVGIYGVVAFGVTQRMREFGIRVAVGATRGGITRAVVWQGTAMAVAGSFVGLVLAIAAAGVMRTLVYGVAPMDLSSMLGAAALLILVAGVASYIPARLAATVDPALSLRSD